MTSSLTARALAIALSCAAITACRDVSAPPPAVAEEAQPVRVAPVRRGAAAAPVRATGSLAGKEEARLAFKIPGFVERMHVDAGASVARGQLLATLKPDEASSRVTQARMAHEKAERDRARAEQLYREGVAALSLVQDARSQEEAARAGLRMASFDAQHAEIRAPADGVVLARFAEESEMVAAGAPMFAFKSAAPGWIVRVGVADRDVVRLRLGDAAKIETNAHPAQPLAGRVTQIAAAASPATGTFDIEVALDPSELLLLSGIAARVEIVPSGGESLSFVPLTALAAGDGDTGTVFALDSERTRARRLDVRFAFLSGDEAALSAGVEGVSEVVTDGVTWLRDGSLVRVMASDVAAAQ
ncbi:MAG: efflux RND transporter periplasmic adaptor subunit [Deltaproteobacteria bacterium]|nr:efflux RND transporter periplasmic adaptor subunit [Deltaproteobacteria bacterium]